MAKNEVQFALRELQGAERSLVAAENALDTAGTDEDYGRPVLDALDDIQELLLAYDRLVSKLRRIT